MSFRDACLCELMCSSWIRGVGLSPARWTLPLRSGALNAADIVCSLCALRQGTGLDPGSSAPLCLEQWRVFLRVGGMSEGKKTLNYRQKELGLIVALLTILVTILLTLCLDLLIMNMHLNVGIFFILKEMNKHTKQCSVICLDIIDG